MMARVLHIALMLGACGLLWLGWSQLNNLRGTVFFEYRYVLLVAAGFLVLSVAQAIAGWIGGRLPPGDDHHGPDA